jgi:hypothetical protein
MMTHKIDVRVMADARRMLQRAAAALKDLETNGARSDESRVLAGVRANVQAALARLDGDGVEYPADYQQTSRG